MDMTHSRLAYVVVFGQLLIALVLVTAICGCLFYKTYADPTTLAAVIVMASTLVGNLGSILGGPRSMMMGPGKTEITNPPEHPVPVTPTQPNE